METGNRGAGARLAHQQITRALAGITSAGSRRYGSPFAVANPSFKRLVLQVFPTAAVKRAGSWEGRQLVSVSYQCFIGSVLMESSCSDGVHHTPNGAWICLARHVAASPEPVEAIELEAAA